MSISRDPHPNCLVRMVYVSRRSDGTSDSDLLDMVSTKDADNRGIGVTSCLWISRHRFFHLIEGPSELVESLFRRIELDPRHIRATPLSMVHIGVRGFPDHGLAAVMEGTDLLADELIHRFADLPPVSYELSEEPEILRSIVLRLQPLVT